MEEVGRFEITKEVDYGEQEWSGSVQVCVKIALYFAAQS
jgi:hypothetical protein